MVELDRKAARALMALALGLLAGCGGGLQRRAIVGEIAPEEFLRLREGPGLGYDVALGLPQGTALVRQDCVTEVGQLWCRVALAGAPSIAGYVSADYLVDR